MKLLFKLCPSIILVLSFLQIQYVAADQDISHPTIPPKAQGVLIVDNLKEGNLIFLRGFAGKGTYFTRNDNGETCSIHPVPFIAGDFEGTNISIHKNKHLKIIVYSTEISKSLLNGKQVESGKFTIHSQNTQPSGDLKIETGLPPTTSFLINPRRKWTTWFRGELKKLKCELLE